ncbi:MAG: cupin domain-containing protein [Actinobacteria bacterium]|nr:cupin domain-containing protein [Actinomycetota bacterium]
MSEAAYVSLPGEGKRLPLVGLLKVASRTTGGSFELIEYHGPVQPPPHVHRDREEAFYILQGTFSFLLGKEQRQAPAGSVVLIPRGTTHSFTAPEDGRALLFIAPAGLEGFFDELGSGLAAGTTPAEMRSALAGRFDSHPVGG